MDWGIFFKALSVVTLFVAMMSGLGYWIWNFTIRKYPNLKYTIKYRVLKKKFNEEDVRMLMEDAEQGVDANELVNALILSNKVNPARVKELLYIYGEIGRIMKGGIIK